MDEMERLKVMVSHWIEHGREHAKTYEEWAERFKDVEGGRYYRALRLAAEKLYESVECLDSILRESEALQ